MAKPAEYSCMVCGVGVPGVNYVTPVSCPACGAVHEYDEGVALRADEVSRLVAERDALKRKLARLRELADRGISAAAEIKNDQVRNARLDALCHIKRIIDEDP